MRIGQVLWGLALLLGGCDAVFGLHRGDDAPVPFGDAPPGVDGLPPVACDTLSALYDITLASEPGHRYRITQDEDAVRRLDNECSADAPAGTHLFAPSTNAEIDQMLVVLTTMDLRMTPLFIGVVQDPRQATVTAGWRLITGGTFDPTLWGVGEPEDASDTNGDGSYKEDDDENVGALWGSSGGLVDNAQSNTYRAICECDGLAVDPNVRAVLAAY